MLVAWQLKLFHKKIQTGVRVEDLKFVGGILKRI